MEIRKSKSQTKASSIQIESPTAKDQSTDITSTTMQKSKPRPKTLVNKYHQDTLLSKRQESLSKESKKEIVPGYRINDLIQQEPQQMIGFKDGQGKVKYNINIISDNPDQITQAQVHSPRIEATDNSPTGSKKPNYLMKSIFCDVKSPSPKAKPSQKSPSQYLNISPIQQYFDLASRKKNNDSYYELNEKNKDKLSKSNDCSPINKVFEGDDTKFFGDFDNSHFGFSKKPSYELWGYNNELDNSMNSGSNSPMINTYGMRGYNNNQMQQEPLYSTNTNTNINTSTSTNANVNAYGKKMSSGNFNTPNMMPNTGTSPDAHYMNIDNGSNPNNMNCNQGNIGPNYNFNIMVIKNSYDDGYIQQQQNQYKKYHSMQPMQPSQSIPPYDLNTHSEKYLNLGYKPMNQNIFPQQQQQHQPQQQPQPPSHQQHQQQHQQSNNNHLNLNYYSLNPKNKMMPQYTPIQNPQYSMMPNNTTEPNQNLYPYPPNQSVNPPSQYQHQPMTNSIPISMPLPTSPQRNQPQFYQQSKPLTNPINTIPLEDGNSVNQAYFLAKDQSGCRFLQKKVDEDPDKAIETMYPIILEHLIELTTEQFGNYLIQKFLEYLDEQRLIQFMGIINPYTNSIGINPYGTRVIQKLMDRINNEKLINSFIIILTPNIISFIKDANGIHIMQKLILMPNITFDFLFEIVCPNISELSTHRIGCCFVQKCFHAIKDHTLDYLLDEIIENTMTLVTNQYGNYVIQNVMLLNDSKRNRRIFDIMMSNFCVFSKHKFASNVIEKFFEYNDLKELLIDKLMYPEAIKLLLFDNFGNYVLQKGLFVASNEKRTQMLYLIAPLLDQLKMVNFGQKLYHKLIVQYPTLSTIMFSLKNNKMNVFIGKKDMNYNMNMNINNTNYSDS